MPTIQEAVDSGVDSVLLRAGHYAETVVVSRPGILLMGAPSASDDIPTVQGLRIAIYRSALYPALYAFRDIRFLNPVVYYNDRNNAAIAFSGCGLRGGMVDTTAGFSDTGAITFTHCHLDSLVRLTAKGGITLDSCWVTGRVSSDIAADVVVRGCAFQGVGGNFTNAILVMDASRCNITGNVIRGYSRGIVAYSGDTIVADNLIEECSYRGIDVEDYNGTITNNIVRRCGYGIYTWLAYKSVVSGNTVTDATHAGLDVWGLDDEVTNNVILRCGGNGMQISYRSGMGWLAVTQNTSCFNAESGFASDTQAQFGQVWTGNIGYGNGWYGANWTRDDGVKMRCNDWFGNGLGAVGGMSMASTDLTVDPMFCNVDSADVKLNSASPLLAESTTCGQIGALTVGCGVTATRVQRFAGGRVSDGVRVVWQVADGATASEVWVERADGANGQAWTEPVMEQSTDGPVVIDLDHSALPDQAYRYRLVARDGGKLVVLDPGILVEAQARLAFRLAEVGPSPGGGPLRIAFTLARAAPIRIDVFDLLGRKVATPALGLWPAGAQVAEWSAQTPAGMYVVRYAYPGGQERRTIVRYR